MPSADQVPVNRSHSTMRWHTWVVLIAGSIGSALRAVRPPNLHITPVVQRDLVHRASATGFLYRSPLAIMAQATRNLIGKRNGGDLGRAPRQQRRASTAPTSMAPKKCRWRRLNLISSATG